MVFSDTELSVDESLVENMLELFNARPLEQLLKLKLRKDAQLVPDHHLYYNTILGH